MKKLTLLLFLSSISFPLLFSQAIQYDVSVKYYRDASGYQADINVKVEKGNPDFTYYLTTNDPVKGEVLMKSEPTKRKSHVFKDVKPGKYFIRIEDNLGLPAGRTIEIKETESSTD